MSHPVTGIDHCYLLVNDLDTSLAQFQRLGFTISPRGLHSASKGTANHTIMLSHNDYFELLGVANPTPENAPRRALLQKDGEGLYAMAGRIEDAEEGKKQLKELGVEVSNVQRFDRPVTLPDGSEGVAAFSIFSFPAEKVPVGIAFVCQHHTRETVWLPELMTHKNGAVALAGMVARHDEPEKAANDYAKLFAAGSVAAVAGGWSVDTGNVPVIFLDADALQHRYGTLETARTPASGFAVLQILVQDLAVTRAVLDASQTPFQPTSNGIAVDPSLASGAIIEFIQG